MPALEFFGQSLRGRYPQGSPSRLVNWYRVPTGQGFMLRSCLGMEAFAQLDGVNVRAAARVRGRFLVVFGGGLWEVTQDGAASKLCDVIDTPEMTISSNNGRITIAGGGNYFVWNGTDVTSPATGAITSVGSVSFFGQRTILTELNGRRVQWSNLLLPSSFNGLDFATTESRDDNNIRGMAFGGEFWVFKRQSIERMGDDNGLYVIPGAAIDKGLKAYNLVCNTDAGGFFVGDDNKAYICGAGGVMQVVSTPAVEFSIANEIPSRAFYYQDEGREFCVISFPSRPAWVYDLTGGEWHERANGNAWDIALTVNAFGGWYGVDNAGNVSKLARVNSDLGLPLRRSAVSAVMYGEGRKPRIAELAARCETGTGAELTLKTSRDRGQTFSPARVKSVGAIGQRETRVSWRALGQFRDVCVELSTTDDVAVNAEMEATFG